MSKYKLRAECLEDIYNFIKKLGETSHTALGTFKVSPCIVEGLRYPDCVLEFKSSLTMNEIKAILKTIPDGHVMLETVNPAERYTGDRAGDTERAV